MSRKGKIQEDKRRKKFIVFNLNDIWCIRIIGSFFDVGSVGTTLRYRIGRGVASSIPDGVTGIFQ